ncbi:MAG: pyruvate kinase [Anaerolineaceae bacterium]|nr:pyruvate kinase [Anaerolineaceae bacterium]
MTRFAKIVATLGPSSSTEERLRQMIFAGMDVARLNFSHGTHEEHAERIKLIRRLSEELNKPIAILMDLQGPKLRIGSLQFEPLPLVAGQQVALSSESPHELPEGITFIPFDVPKLHEALEPGNHILMDDGNLELEVLKVDGENIFAKVLIGGDLKSHKGVNLPGSKLNIPILTEKDKADLQFGLQQGLDLVALSFVKNASDIEFARKTMQTLAPGKRLPPIVAKLERPEALENLEEIMRVTNGVMVARGDLGVEMSPADVPSAQKRIIRMANEYGRFVITATQMLESMINNPRPTRAEAADVANAIYDGTDAVMLSAESAAGNYPVESIATMGRIVEKSEAHLAEWGHAATLQSKDARDDAAHICIAANDLARDADVAAIVVFTVSGNTAMWTSKTRPQVPIYAFTPERSTLQWVNVCRGVVPFFVPHADTLETMITHVETAITSSTDLKAGEQVVVVSGFPVGQFRTPNLTLLYTIRG